jgi:Tol biopolymer transport system component
MAAPTGDRIALTSGNSTELRVVDLATGTVTLLVETDGQTCSRSPIFSREGERILFSRTEVGGSYVSSLWSINADGSNPRRLVTGTAWGGATGNRSVRRAETLGRWLPRGVDQAVAVSPSSHPAAPRRARAERRAVHGTRSWSEGN